MTQHTKDVKVIKWLIWTAVLSLFLILNLRLGIVNAQRVVQGDGNRYLLSIALNLVALACCGIAIFLNCLQVWLVTHDTTGHR